MKKKICAILACLLACLIILTGCVHVQSYVADPITFTYSQLAGAAYAMGSSMGIQWGFTGTANSAESQMIGLLKNYAGTDSIDWWGAGEIKAIAGKLAIVQTGYESVKGVYEHLKEFIDNLIDNEDTPIISDGDVIIDGNHYVNISNGKTDVGFSATSSGGYHALYYYGQQVAGISFGNSSYQLWIYLSGYDSQRRQYKGTFGVGNGYVAASTSFYYNSIDYAGSYIDYQNADKSLYPQALPLQASWQGDWGQAPDTNLDQLIGSVFDDIADLGDIDVTGDIVEPAPGPTPVPTYPPATDVLGGINTEIEQGNDVIQGLNDLQDLMEGVNEGLNDIDLGVGEAAGTISDAIGEQTETLEGAIADNAGVVSGAIDQAVSDVESVIGTQTGAISDSIDQAVSDVQTAIGEQTAALDESLSATAEGVETISEAIADEEINWRKFDLRGLFPFCIPFDIYNMLKALDATPTAPHVQLPFVIQSIGFSYMLDLDFSVFDPVAAIMRQMELICYALALAWATSKVIKW